MMFLSSILCCCVTAVEKKSGELPRIQVAFVTDFSWCGIFTYRFLQLQPWQPQEASIVEAKAINIIFFIFSVGYADLHLFQLLQVIALIRQTWDFVLPAQFVLFLEPVVKQLRTCHVQY